MKTPQVIEANSQQEIVDSIKQSEKTRAVVSTTLRTSERVIARVTDGIYRQPGSAIRELVSNAYDADATRVVITTDAPSFERIVVEDDGHGMAPHALAYLLQHIGGSAKRRDEGASLGMTSSKDPTLSPKGRKLIGKIGIGLFSVSQLTNSFQIITKTKGDNFRTVATVVMRQYSDIGGTSSEGAEEDFESGKVNIWRERAVDLDVHGTTIILNNIRRQARDTLRSNDIWSAIEQNELVSTEEKQELEPPKYHIGRMDSTGKKLRLGSDGSTASLPWDVDDNPKQAFEKLVNCVWDEVDDGNPNPKLDSIFDHYLRMVWQLALAVPLPYVDGHLFDKPASGWAQTFALSNGNKGSAAPVEDKGQTSIRKNLKLQSRSTSGFSVLFDDLELTHPIIYENLPTTSSAVKKPLIFIGKVEEKFPGIPFELSAGPLEFEAYLFWAPKIAPVEHQGSLVRVNGASGTLFDSTFMRYQVQELQRLKQITCEIFVTRGLDSALNIDRESFNVAHPHAVYITKWLHSALRQLATAQKRVASEIRGDAREIKEQVKLSAIQRIANMAWKEQSGDETSEPPEVYFESPQSKIGTGKDAYVFDRSVVAPTQQLAPRTRETAQSRIVEQKVKAIAQVLASFDLLDSLSKKKQQSLLKAIYEILESGE